MSSLGVKTVPVRFTNKGVDYTVQCKIESFRHFSDVEALVDELHKKGIRAVVDASGACSSDEEGHFHAAQVNIHGITEKQARKLLR